MNRQYVYGISGFIIGVVLAGLVSWYTVPNREQQPHNMTGGAMIEGMAPDVDQERSRMYGAMVTMLRNLEGKSGDEFDKAFLTSMVVHHQAAIDMANAAMKNARHQELKDLSKAIIDTQTQEVNQMKAWETSWYGQ